MVPIVITFAQNPARLMKRHASASILTLKQKLTRLAELGVQCAVQPYHPNVLQWAGNFKPALNKP